MLYDLLVKRRSIRKYLPQRVDKQIIDELLRSVLRSPRGNNIDLLKFIFIDDSEIIEKLSYSKKAGSRLLKNAPSCLIILADENKSDVWIEDAAIATTIAHLSASSLGLGSCWVQVRNRYAQNEISTEEYVRDLLDIPTNMRVEAILALGYPDEEKAGHSEDSLLLNNIYHNGFVNNYNL